MRKILLLATAVAATAAFAVPAQAAPPEIPWGEEITVIPGACVTEPCPFPYTVTVPDRPF